MGVRLFDDDYGAARGSHRRNSLPRPDRPVNHTREPHRTPTRAHPARGRARSSSHGGPGRAPSRRPRPTGGSRPSRYPWRTWPTTSPPSLTQATYDRLQAELEDLTTRGRVEIARAIEAARALGDLSENGDYHAAKDTQGKMESRIRQAPAHPGPRRHRRRRGGRELRDGGGRVGRGHPLRRRRRDRAVPGRIDRGAPRRAQRRLPGITAGPGPARARPRATWSSTRPRAAPCGSRSSRSAADRCLTPSSAPRPRPSATRSGNATSSTKPTVSPTSSSSTSTSSTRSRRLRPSTACGWRAGRCATPSSPWPPPTTTCRPPTSTSPWPTRSRPASSRSSPPTATSSGSPATRWATRTRASSTSSGPSSG